MELNKKSKTRYWKTLLTCQRRIQIKVPINGRKKVGIKKLKIQKHSSISHK